MADVVIASVDDIEELADEWSHPLERVIIPADLLLVLYQRDPQFMYDWFESRD